MAVLPTNQLQMNMNLGAGWSSAWDQTASCVAVPSSLGSYLRNERDKKDTTPYSCNCVKLYGERGDENVDNRRRPKPELITASTFVIYLC